MFSSPIYNKDEYYCTSKKLCNTICYCSDLLLKPLCSINVNVQILAVVWHSKKYLLMTSICSPLVTTANSIQTDKHL